jgi:hypothetical protein
MKSAQRILLLGGLVLFTGVTAAEQENGPRFSISAGAEYTTGTYGGDADIEDFYVPLKATMDFGRLSFRLTLPYLSVRAPEGTVITGPGGEPVPGTGDIVTNSGIGDVIGSVTIYDVIRNRRLGFAMDLTGRVKFGTADVDKGLGTGENDFTVQADFLKFTDSITWIGSAGYKFRGQPPGATLDDALLASAGGIYKFSDDTRAGMFFDYRESSIGADPTQELSVFLSNRIGVDWRLQAFVFRGFTDSGADWGAGLQVKRYMPSLR